MRKSVCCLAIAALSFGIGVTTIAYFRYFQQPTHPHNQSVASLLLHSETAAVEAKPSLLCDDALLYQIASEKLRDGDFSDLLEQYNPQTFNCSENFRVKKVDLNRDKVSEIVVQGSKIPLCTVTGNCEFWIYIQAENGYEPLLMTGDVQQYRFLKTMSNGHRDVETKMHGSAYDSVLSVYKFDGKQYQLAESWNRSYSYIDKQGRFRVRSKPLNTP